MRAETFVILSRTHKQRYNDYSFYYEAFCFMFQVSVNKRDSSDEISDPIVDLAILTMAEHFIGNCVSSFTSFVTRYRAVDDKPTSFWAFDEK